MHSRTDANKFVNELKGRRDKWNWRVTKIPQSRRNTKITDDELCSRLRRISLSQAVRQCFQSPRQHSCIPARAGGKLARTLTGNEVTRYLWRPYWKRLIFCLQWRSSRQATCDLRETCCWRKSTAADVE